MLMQQVIEKLKEAVQSAAPAEHAGLRLEIEKWVHIRAADLKIAIRNSEDAVSDKYRSLWAAWAETIQRQIAELESLKDMLGG